MQADKPHNKKSIALPNFEIEAEIMRLQILNTKLLTNMSPNSPNKSNYISDLDKCRYSSKNLLGLFFSPIKTKSQKG